ncbi:MAG: hypothetical protein R6U96_06690 [Promethearchaeia archaeon]
MIAPNSEFDRRFRHQIFEITGAFRYKPDFCEIASSANKRENREMVQHGQTSF